MDKNEARLWLITIVRAQQGDEESREMVETEN